MSFLILFILLGVSITGLAFLSAAKLAQMDFMDEHDLYYPLGLLAVLVLGVSVFFLGLKLFSSETALWAGAGTFLLVSGIQITLWTIGIRLEFFGNKSTVEDPFDSILPRFGAMALPLPSLSLLFNPSLRMALRRELRESQYSRYRYSFAEDLFERINLPRGLMENLSPLQREISYVLSHQEETADIIPFLRELLVSIEQIKLQMATSEELLEETKQRLIEAVAQFRAEFRIRLWQSGFV